MAKDGHVVIQFGQRSESLRNGQKTASNRIGVSICELLERDKMSLKVRGLDATYGTPVLDIKPWFSELIPMTPISEPRWAKVLMTGYS